MGGTPTLSPVVLKATANGRRHFFLMNLLGIDLAFVDQEDIVLTGLPITLDEKDVTFYVNEYANASTSIDLQPVTFLFMASSGNGFLNLKGGVNGKKLKKNVEINFA
ncbi:hypothetical protein TNCV_4172241 [Trichonephila clavipes]|nr:hypothetical protein TNCV_4172241 [Trichonephila clavipes]